MTRDRIGRLLMWFVAALTMIAFADGLRRMALVGPDRIWVETWRTFAYVVFAGLFSLLALRPRETLGLWELTFAHKIAVVLFGLTLGNVPEAQVAMVVDAVLVVLIAVSWWLCRGWVTWSKAIAQP